MPQELGLPKFWDFKTIPTGTQVVKMGEYLGAMTGKFGAQHRFRQLEDNIESVISGNAVNWRVEHGHIREGEVFDVYFEGKEILKKGKMSGKEVNNFKFAKYSRQELEAAGHTVSTPVPVAITATPKGPRPVAEPLGDLE